MLNCEKTCVGVSFKLAAPLFLRQMRLEDVPRVMSIEKECFPTPWHESAYLTEISNRSAYYIVAADENDIYGYAGMWVIMDEAHITTLGVAKNARGKKTGERLLVGLLDEAMKRGARRATLEVRQSNEVAQNLYRKYGFIPAAIRRGYYTDNNENAIVMWIDNMADMSFVAKYKMLKRKLEAEIENAAIEGVA